MLTGQRRLLCSSRAATAGDFWTMFLQRHEVIKGIDPGELAGVDQTHKDVADMGATKSLVEERILSVQDSPFQCLLA